MQTRNLETDVLVVGGGTAGGVAAIQSARAGAKTLLLEFSGQLGGTTATGGVNNVSLFGSQGRQLIAGIGWDLIRKTFELSGDGTVPDITQDRKTRPGTPVMVNQWLYPCIVEEAAIDAGVTLAYHTWVESVKRDESGNWQVAAISKNERLQITCREMIDCTGGAEIAGLLGCQRLYGENNDDAPEHRQPGTLIFHIGNCDITALNTESVQQLWEAEIAAGRLKRSDYAYGDRNPFVGFIRSGGRNAMHVPGADDTTGSALTQANIYGRRAVLRLLRFIRTLPGCGQATLNYVKQDTAIRETYRIVGETTVTGEDYMTGRVFDDAVGYSYWYIDIHTDHGSIHEFLAPGVFPTVPLSAMVPKGSRNLLVAGRSISSDRRANSALRIQATCMVMGQAAGAAAALGIQLRCASKDVPIDQLRSLLKAHGAILPPNA